MYKINFQKPIHIHFIGIGGISMSGLAEILLEEGFTVSGSDAKESPLTKKLESEGAVIHYGQCAENITDDINCVVYTAAINKSNPELMEAVGKKIPMLTRAELLGQLMKNYDTPIAVSGTHGKTTTTSMISEVLLAADMDPTISVGGILKTIGGNIRVGKSGNFITEACEYTNSFLHFYPKISVILNIEEDHLDFFKDLEDIRHSFHQFSALLPSDGTLIINGDIKDYQEIYEGLDCNVITYGSSAEFDYSATEIQYDEKGFVYKALQYGKSAVKVGAGVVKIAGAVALVAGSGGAALPVAACITLSACNDIYNGMMDATYTYTGDYNKVGNTNALKDFLVKKGGETGEILFGDEKLGEKMGSWAYTGLDVVSFLNGVDKLGKSFGKLQTITSGTAETSKVWGEIHMDDVIDNDLKYLSKDGIIKTILNIDPNSVANFGYDVVTGTIKSIKSAGKLGNTIADLAVG